jgi:hypothetical protein
MVIVPLPKPPELEKLLCGLLMRSVKVVVSQEEAPSTGPFSTALFATEEPVLQVLVRADLVLSISLAAALSVVPLSAARECVASGKMDESLRDNFGEVMNVLSRFLSGGGRTFRLGAVTCPPTSGAAELLPMVEGSVERRAFKVDVPGYLAGRLEFVTL